VKISEKRVLEWWELPGIDGREAFDEEILFLNEFAENGKLPRWALLIRDLLPRWGFEPCAHRFFDGLEQVLAMIGSARPGPRLGGCGDIPPFCLSAPAIRWPGVLGLGGGKGWGRGRNMARKA
jgi:hypothetical protein